MKTQTYLPRSQAFDRALDAFEEAVRDGDPTRVNQAREAVQVAAPQQAAEYDEEVRRGFGHLFARWRNGDLPDLEFGSRFQEMLNAAQASPAPSRVTFELAFPHLNHSVVPLSRPNYASIQTQRLWLQHQALAQFRHTDRSY